MATTISHYGVSFTVAENVPTFVFANGEEWFVSPTSLTVTAVSIPPHQFPDANTRLGGAMVNPVPGGLQGYATAIDFADVHQYSALLDVSLQLPYVLNPGDTLVASRTRKDISGGPQFHNKNTIYVIVGVGVLATAPAAGSLRPGLYGAGPHLVAHNISDFDWSSLQNYGKAALPSLATQAFMEADARNPALPFWGWGQGWESSTISPWLNAATNSEGAYGVAWAAHFGRKLLWLNCNWTQAQKQKCANQLVQQGIDIYHYHLNGGNFFAGGTHHIGTWSPLVFAARMLQDSAMLAMAAEPYRSTEKSVTTWFVTEADVGREVYNSQVTGITASKYTLSHVGLPEWGMLHAYAPYSDDARFLIGQGYRGTWANIVGSIMAMRFMGLETVWNWLPTFAYTERFIAANGLAGIELEMYNAHYGNLGPLSPQATTFSPNSNTLESGSYLSLVAAAGLTIYYTTNGTTPTDSSTLYTAPLLQSASLTYKAIAYSAVSGQLPSPVATRSITVDTTGAPGPVSNFTVTQTT